jgi:hypothetical protein
VRFQVLTAASMMFRAVFWFVLPCKMITQKTALNRRLMVADHKITFIIIFLIVKLV